jgi:hypothetical protein
MTIVPAFAPTELIKTSGGYRYKLGLYRSVWYPSEERAQAAALQTQRLITVGKDRFWTTSGESNAVH